MIAQKIVDAKQTQIPRRPAIAAPDPCAAALGTPTTDHFPHRLSLKCIQRHRSASRGFKVAAVWSYWNRFVLAPWPSAWPGAPVAILFLWSLAQPPRRDRRSGRRG